MQQLQELLAYIALLTAGVYVSVMAVALVMSFATLIVVFLLSLITKDRTNG
jgi:hypothetical protein